MVMVSRTSDDQTKEQVVEIAGLLFRSARKSVKLSTAFTHNLADAVAEDIKASLGRVESFDILLDGRADFAAVEKRYPWLIGNPKVHVRQAPGPIPHWIVIDNRDFRMEKPHTVPSPGLADEAWHPRHNMTVLDATPEAAAELVQQYEALGAGSRQVKC